MKKLKLLSTVLLATAVAMTSFVGCGNSGGKDSGKDKPVEITWWNFPNFEVKDGQVGKYEEELIKSFEEKNPDIKVNVEMISFNGGGEKLNAAIASNSAPDILYDAPGRIIDFARQGVLAPVDDMIKALNGDVSDELLAGCKLEDTYYMYPFNTTTFMMAANKTMFEEAGLLDLLPLKKEDRLWTIEEFEAALKGIKEAKPDVIPMAFFSKSTAGDQGTRAFVSNLYGGSVMNNDQTSYTFDEEPAVKSMEWVKKSIESGLIGSGSEALASNDAIDLFLQQKSAFTILYSTGLKKNNADKKIGDFEEVLLPIPSPSKDKLALEALIGGLCVFNNGDDAKIEASKKFIDFLANDPDWQKKNLVATGTFSVRDSIKGLYDEEEMKFAEGMGKYTAEYYNTVNGFAEMRTHWFPALQEITLGQTPAKEALKNFNDKANETLNKK
ncbi:ABC transporter substrate-binding protein [Clostridium septicum]|uniref:ABC transporter substrate-binding protein n=1 Tax=Clostridium septicum TaxID=1504 RepID=A0A9N7JKK0_CLOSE|nr:extracellular solute-binding protein [Clostridium septicum]AYE33592.1 ABC transporter substrate-binding protein [Clostridium septicum]QAS61756.1 extracellular solute-binding protein [Clostridium septicum]UEC21797.1 extracellular solute-binding protein [Clostridium septicum]USS00151.1 extracellular solute-binding protein [Clostridium septicum]